MAGDQETTTDHRVEQLAMGQCGAVALRQLRNLGLTDRQIRRRVDSRRWTREAPGVYSFPGHAEAWLRQVWIAHLHAGSASVVSHRSAGLLHGFDAIAGRPIDLTVSDRRTRPLTGTRRFHNNDLSPLEMVQVDGLPVTTPARTLVDLAGIYRYGRLSETVESALLRRIVTIDDLVSTIDRIRRRGKPGIALLDRVIASYRPGDPIARSVLERLLDHVIELAGLPTPVHEHPLPSPSGFVGFVDRCWPEAKLIAEADGRRWHDRRQQAAKDHHRDNEAARVGYLTSRMWWEHLRHDAQGSADMLRDIYRVRCS